MKEIRISGRALLAGVIGWPVAHSLSPLLHNAWLRKYGIDGLYAPLGVNPENLAEVLEALPKMGFRGVNLTLPHKEEAMLLVDEKDAAAEAIGAINTLLFAEGR